MKVNDSEDGEERMESFAGCKSGGGYFIKGPTKNKESVLSIVWQDVCVCVCVCVCGVIPWFFPSSQPPNSWEGLTLAN